MQKKAYIEKNILKKFLESRQETGPRVEKRKKKNNKDKNESMNEVICVQRIKSSTPEAILTALHTDN